MNVHLLLPMLLLPAKLLEELARRVRLPGVTGPILAGVLLGAGGLGLIPSEAADPEGHELVQRLSQIGLCVLLFRVGLETRIEALASVWRSAMLVAAVGMLLPLALGWAVGLAWGWSHQAALFLGATLTATSIGVTAAVLAELRAQESREGLIIVGAAVVDDVLGLLLLSGLVAVMSPTLSVSGEITQALAQAVVFIAAGVFLGRYVVGAVVWVSRWDSSSSLLLVMAFSYFMLLAHAARVVGLDAIIGAYAAGLAFSRHPAREALDRDLRPLLDILTPLFFLLVGASVEPAGLNPFTPTGRQALGFAGVLLLVASAGKLASGAVLRGPINRWAIGSGMMPRGEVGLIFAQIGLGAGLLAAEQFSSIVLVLVATSVAGPVLLRLSWRSHPVPTPASAEG